MKKRSDQSELTSWIRTYTRDLISWAFHKTSDLQTAEDLVQDTFVVAAETLAAFRNESHPKTWLIGILNNKISEHFKYRARHATVNLDNDRTVGEFFDDRGHWKNEYAPHEWEETSGHLLDDEEFNRIFQRCLGRLPSQWFACLSMKYLEEKDPKKVCQELAISPTNYWQIVHRAKLQLRDCLEKHWFEKE